MSLQPKWLTLITIVLLLTTSSLVEAQQNDQFKPYFMIGVGGGPVFTQVDFVPVIPQTTTQGLSMGIAAKYVSEKYLGIGVM